MYPQVFLETFWRLELRPQIFVAMSFDDKYKPRFDEVIAPAIRSIKVGDVQLEPYRVDISKSGDSILTDIMDGIAHSQMVLADVSSSVGKDSVTSRPYRNANVMYEVGLALACRQSVEVLLIRDDKDRFLFDVSTIPHMTIDFSDRTSATAVLSNQLMARLNERNYINDARVRLAIASLSTGEAEELKSLADLPAGTASGRRCETMQELLSMRPIERLFDKQLIRVVAQFEEGFPAYQLTPLGRAAARFMKSGLLQVAADSPKDEDVEKDEEEGEAGG